MKAKSMEILPLGDSGVIVRFGQEISADVHRQVMALAAYLDEYPFPGMVESVPAFTTLTVFYHPWVISYPELHRMLDCLAGNIQGNGTEKPNVVDIPVCYGAPFGPDLETVAMHNHMTAEEVIFIHTNADYLVYMIGFAPGFPYLGGMSEKISAPRLSTPRLAIPAGSVGIAGTQTGIYPVETPGGWQLIGRTPLRLFQPEVNPPSLLKPGDTVRFRAITMDEYNFLLEEPNP